MESEKCTLPCYLHVKMNLELIWADLTLRSLHCYDSPSEEKNGKFTVDLAAFLLTLEVDLAGFLGTESWNSGVKM